jgi:hypothetical protein
MYDKQWTMDPKKSNLHLAFRFQGPLRDLMVCEPWPSSVLGDARFDIREDLE